MILPGQPILEIDQLTRDLHSYDDLIQIAAHLAPSLNLPFKMDSLLFLMALSGVETDFGDNNVSRFEPSYSWGGAYAKNLNLQVALKLYGSTAACSYGPWQILYISAAELGYQGHPLDLWHGEVSGPYVIQKLNKLSERGADTLEKILTAYNMGTFKDRIATRYIQRFQICFEKIRDTER